MHELDPESLAIHNSLQWEWSPHSLASAAHRGHASILAHISHYLVVIFGVHVYFFTQIPRSQEQEYYCLHVAVSVEPGMWRACGNKGPESCGHCCKREKSEVSDLGNIQDYTHTEPREPTTIF